MIIYTEEDKELVIPTGLGNLNSSSDYDEGYNDGVNDQKAKLLPVTFTENGTYTRADGWNRVYVNVSGSSCEGVYEQGFSDGYGEGWREGFASGATSTSGTAYQQGYNVGWQDGVSEGFRRVSEQSIELSFSGNGSWEKPFFDDIYARKVVVDVQQELVKSFMIVFKGNQPLQESDIVSAYIDGVFVVDKADVIHNNNSTILIVYGHPISKQNRVSQISFSIPTSVFSQWSELSSTGEMGINGTRTSGGGYEGGIGVTPIGLSSTADGNNTKITITLI